MTIVIDDDQFDLLLARRIFGKFPSIEAPRLFDNPEEALAFLNEQNENCQEIGIFLDLNMPRMDGWQFLEELISVFPAKETSPRVIVLSSSINPADMKKSTNYAAVSQYLVKPLSLQAITDLQEKGFFR